MPRGKAALKCPKCGKKFKHPMHLGRHMSTTHGRATKKKSTRSIAFRAKTALRKQGTFGGRLVGQLETIMSKLHAGRQKLAEELHAMDSVLERFGISFGQSQPGSQAVRRGPGRPKGSGKRGPGRPRKETTAPAPKATKGRKRRKFAVTGDQSILNYIKKAGKAGRTGAEVVKNWLKEGRGAGAYVTLGKLVKAKKLKKEKIEGKKGSTYRAG